MIDNVDMTDCGVEEIVCKIITYHILVIRALHPMVLARKNEHVKPLSCPYKRIGKTISTGWGHILVNIPCDKQ